jgi:hypothetical protein
MFTVTFTAELERSTHGRGTYTSVTADEETSDFLASLPLQRGGFGSIPCLATVGTTTWRTSVFPSRGSYLLLLNKKVVAAEDLYDGEPVTVELELFGD